MEDLLQAPGSGSGSGLGLGMKDLSHLVSFQSEGYLLRDE